MDVEPPAEGSPLSDAPGCGPLVPHDRLTKRPLKLQVFERVRAGGTMSRVQVARELDVSPASVTTLTSELIDRGFLEEIAAAREPGDLGRGRPPVALGVRGGAAHVAGIKLSEEVYTAVLLDLAGQKIADAMVEVPRDLKAAPDVLDTAAALLEQLLDLAGLERSALSTVGLGLPGFVDHHSGEVHWSPILTDVPLNFAAMAQARFGLPVVIDNDANLVALAELWFGAGRNLGEVAVVTIEHGVGMGLVTGHRIYRGARGLGMELGHVKVQLDGALCRCGQRGCLEAYVSDYALAREADTAMGRLHLDRQPRAQQLETLYEQAKAGHPQARSIFARAGRFLTAGLSTVVALFDPELIIVSGGRMRYDFLYATETLAELPALTPRTGRPAPQVMVHARGDLIWAYGAAALALSAVTEALLVPSDGTTG